MPLSKFSDENVNRRLRKRMPEEFAKAGMDAMVPVAKSPENYTIVVIGGAGKHSAFIPTFGNTRLVTRGLKHEDGRDVLSIQELRRG